MWQSGPINTSAVNIVFREPVRQFLEKIKNEPFFKWPNKMAGDPTKRNQNPYCHYYQEQGHTTEDCRNLWDYLDQLVGEGKLKSLLHHSSRRGTRRIQIPKRMLSMDLLWGQSMSFLLLLGEPDFAPPG